MQNINKNLTEKPEVTQARKDTEKKGWFKTKVLPLVAGLMLTATVAFGGGCSGADLSSRNDGQFVTKNDFARVQKPAVETLNIVVDKIAETKKETESKTPPMVYLTSVEKIMTEEDKKGECDPCALQTQKDTMNKFVKIEIDLNGKKGDGSFATAVNSVDNDILKEIGCEKNSNKITCDNLKQIEEICDGQKITCKGNALANITGELKEKIKEVAMKVYGWLLGNGSCDKKDIIIVDPEGKTAEIIGYDETKIPEANEPGGDCYRAPGNAPSITFGVGSVGTK